MNVADAKGLAFSCLPGCGFCCTVRPLVAPREAAALGALVTRDEDGTLRIPLRGPACSGLGADRACGVYDARPTVCRQFPYHIHAGRRIQVTMSLACPGVVPGEGADLEASAVAERALANPGAADLVRRAKETFAEFDRRMNEWGVAAPPDKLRAAFLPHVATLAQPSALPPLFAAIADGDLLLPGHAAKAVGGLFGTEADMDVPGLLAEAAADAFADPTTALWVEPDLAWTSVRAERDALVLVRERAGERRETRVAHDALPTDWDDDASALLAAHLARLLARDRTEGAAAWVVDASGYQATPAAAFARVVGEAALHVMLRAGALAAADGAARVGAAHARRGVAAYETSYHSLPTLGALL